MKAGYAELLTEVSIVLVLYCSSMKGSNQQAEGRDWCAPKGRTRKLKWKNMMAIFRYSESPRRDNLKTNLKLT